MEGHRYADDSEPSWYAGRDRYDPEVSGAHAARPHESGVHERPSGAFRLPEQRPVSAHDQTRVPVRGPEYPTIKPSTGQQQLKPMAEPTSLVPPVAPRREPVTPRVKGTRPVSAIVVGVVLAVLLIPVVRLLIEATFASSATPRSIVPAVLLTLGFALSGVGLFGMVRGGPVTRDSWLSPPVAYLPAGLIMLLAAGLSVA